MWNRKKQHQPSPFVESFVEPSDSASEPLNTKEPSPNWETLPHVEGTPFTQEFFQDSHPPHQDDENTSLRVLGI